MTYEEKQEFILKIRIQTLYDIRAKQEAIIRDMPKSIGDKIIAPIDEEIKAQKAELEKLFKSDTLW